MSERRTSLIEQAVRLGFECRSSVGGSVLARADDQAGELYFWVPSECPSTQLDLLEARLAPLVAIFDAGFAAGNAAAFPRINASASGGNLQTFQDPYRLRATTERSDQ